MAAMLHDYVTDILCYINDLHWKLQRSSEPSKT